MYKQKAIKSKHLADTHNLIASCDFDLAHNTKLQFLSSSHPLCFHLIHIKAKKLTKLRGSTFEKTPNNPTNQTHSSYNILMMQMHKQAMFSKAGQLSFSKSGSTGFAFRTVLFFLWFSVLLAPLYRHSQSWAFVTLLLWISKSLMERLLFILNETN